ncbi:carbohydrate ABC transporter permease [Myceligenerans salitolerans]|uniref:Sugar ABC transporter permease n=1 Tax=Myceligenerans salitolerans TaxID=1230528 RepID=A0ABS3IA53_9MICO|nr:sugar ABC transporter permease [Myceligenerans salitolerans]MBO0609911.1 sugar ABC transporter permease [Myceligenerans salitolerans]
MSALTTAEPVAGSSSPAPRAPRRLGFSQALSRWDVKVSPYLYISPFFVLFALTGLFPLAYTAVVSVYDWNLLGGQGEFVGWQNYAEVLGQATFWKSLVNTLSIFVLSAVPQVVMAITLAALLDQNLRNATFWRMGVLVPYVVAPIAVSLIFGRLFADQYGLINEVLGLVGIDPVGWHQDRFASHVAIAAMVNYRWTGYNTLIFLAAMQAVPRDLYEAATIDGAGRVRQFFSVTVPQIRSTIIFVVITASIGGLQIFDEPRLFDNGGLGGADRQWMTTVLYLYDVAWGNQRDFGRAAAVAWILFVLILAIGFVNFLASGRIASSGSRAPKVERAVTRRLRAEARAAGAPDPSTTGASSASTTSGMSGAASTPTTDRRDS